MGPAPCSCNRSAVVCRSKGRGSRWSAATACASGVAQLAKPQQLFRERAPLLLTAQKERDFSFLPLNTGGRELNLSRFDTGGAQNAASTGRAKPRTLA